MPDTENDFDADVKVVDQDTAEQRVTEPAQHDEDLYKAQVASEPA